MSDETGEKLVEETRVSHDLMGCHYIHVDEDNERVAAISDCR